MIIHTVAFKTKHPAGSPQEQAFLTAGVVLAKLPMVNNFQCYRQVGQKNEYDFGFSMEFTNQADYDAYSNHPEHVAFVENIWKQEIDVFLELDYVKHESF
ncbi:Dabb family protein [Halioxenophilus aromaticivorans]|uniref:Dabb family protein n=1 Tax=Halioxenophilus aromaticivorans TaxID=1306992 RepID=A0AAV3U258_9ALTE